MSEQKKITGSPNKHAIILTVIGVIFFIAGIAIVSWSKICKRDVFLIKEKRNVKRINYNQNFLFCNFYWLLILNTYKLSTLKQKNYEYTKNNTRAQKKSLCLMGHEDCKHSSIHIGSFTYCYDLWCEAMQITTSCRGNMQCVAIN